MSKAPVNIYDPMKNGETVTPRQAAEILQVSVASVQHSINDGALKSVFHKAHGRYRAQTSKLLELQYKSKDQNNEVQEKV